jgi:transcriptional regulator with XRE-family HTH domain
MITKEDLGARVRGIRKERGLTLKQLESSSGFSATHISEIERGKTSPTVGALLRIARALEKDPSYFLEEERLSEVAILRAGRRPPLPEERTQAGGEYLSPGIPGGRLNAYLLRLDAGDARTVLYEAHAGEEAFYVLQGRIEVTLGERRLTAGPGDSVHYGSDRPHGFRNTGEGPVELILISTKHVGRTRTTSGTTGRLF